MALPLYPELLKNMELVTVKLEPLRLQIAPPKYPLLF
jgi:hypothetical protein